LAEDIDWTLCDTDLKRLFEDIVLSTPLIADKDKNAFSVNAWKNDERSDNFIYGRL
jgi:hypothetical protein